MLSTQRSYGTRELAEAVGQTKRTIQRFLRERHPDHEGWWKFSSDEFTELVQVLELPGSQRRYGGRRLRKRGNHGRNTHSRNTHSCGL